MRRIIGKSIFSTGHLRLDLHMSLSTNNYIELNIALFPPNLQFKLNYFGIT